MKKQTVNYSWPAILSDFSKDEVQGNFTRGKLKVFYIGETADHRKFSKEFAENLVQTLKYTPVVSCYDEEADDFVGHAQEQQIFGIVDPCIEPTFEEDSEGKIWCVCDVVYYTERPDKVGEIAKKIAGHKHSLELDQKTIKYVVNYDERKRFKNIEFTAGSFVGVSVLGQKQKPAFTGASFFSKDSDFMMKMQILKDYCENGLKEVNPTQDGGQNMDLQEFMTLSYGEISLKVDEAICNEYAETAYTQVIDMFDDSAICRFYFYVENTSKLMRIKYSCDENGNVTLGAVNEVHITYEDVQEISENGTAAETEENDAQVVTATAEVSECNVSEEQVSEETENVENNEFSQEENNSEVEETVVEETPVEETAEVVEQEQTTTEVFNEVEADSTAETTEETTEVVENESTPNFSEESVNNETPIQENNSSTSAFTDSEKEEYEALKREKKVNLLNSFKESLTEEEFAAFEANIDSYDEKDLELELLRKHKNATAQQQQSVRVFSYVRPYANDTESGDSLDRLVRKNLKK